MMAPDIVDRSIAVVEEHENLAAGGDDDDDEASCVSSSIGSIGVFEVEGALRDDGKNNSKFFEKTKSTTALLNATSFHSIASSTSMSSFMSSLLNQSADELGVANEEFKITIVQDNAKTERRGDEIQPKLVPLQRSQSKQRSMCRWTGDRNTDTTTKSSSSSNLRRREVSDSCLSGMLKRTVRRRDSDERPKPPPSASSYSCRSSNSNNKKHQRSSSGRVRPSMISSASDSNLLKMPVRTVSPRLTKNTIGGSNAIKIKSSSNKTKNKNATWGCDAVDKSDSRSSNNNTSDSPLSSQQQHQTTSKNLFEAMDMLGSTSRKRSSSSRTRSSSSSNVTGGQLSKCSSSGNMLNRHYTSSSSTNANANLPTMPNLGGATTMSTPSLRSLGTGATLSSQTKNGKKESSVLRNPALMGLDNIRVGSNGTYQSTGNGSRSSIQQQILQQQRMMGILGVGGDKQQKTSPNSGSQELKASILNNPVALERFKLIQQQQKQQQQGVVAGTMMMTQRQELASSSSTATSGPIKMKDPTALPGGFQLKKIKNPNELGLKLPERQSSIENGQDLDFS